MASDDQDLPMAEESQPEPPAPAPEPPVESPAPAPAPAEPEPEPEPEFTGPMVLEWDADLGEQVLRPATDAELADIAERQAMANVVPVPKAVTMRQARLALLGAGMLDDVEAAIASLPSPHKEAAKIEWEYSQEVQRHNGFVAQLGPALGLDDAALDALFVVAKGL